MAEAPQRRGRRTLQDILGAVVSDPLNKARMGGGDARLSRMGGGLGSRRPRRRQMGRQGGQRPSSGYSYGSAYPQDVIDTLTGPQLDHMDQVPNETRPQRQERWDNNAIVADQNIARNAAMNIARDTARGFTPTTQMLSLIHI